tara:strand:- start:20 stop:484 length:465 start_codon:yes stop_codon:yes gene_type:complete
MQTALLPPMVMAEAEPPAPPPPEPIPNVNAEDLPTPPCFMEAVKQAAEARLPSKACTPMMLQRSNMLLQDVVEAACMCIRAQVDTPLLVKHLLGTEHAQAFLASEKAKLATEGDGAGSKGSKELDSWSAAVLEHVGDVRTPAALALASAQPPRR